MPRLVWRWRFINTIGWTGVSIAAYGLLQKAGVVPILAERGFQESVFGTYDYHGNAGAFLNLAIPALFAMAARNRSPAPIAGLFLCLAASLANISRAGMVIAILVLIAMVFMTGLWLTGKMRRRALMGILIAVIVATAAGGGAAWRRWQSFDGLNNPRLLMLQLAAPMAIDAGFFGDGPGSFKLLYFNSPHLPGALYSRWRVTIFRPGEETDVNSYVHNDYLQFIIEWGFLGGLLWAILLGSTMTLGIAAFRRAITREERLILAAALIAPAGVLAHSLVDWPLQVASLQLYTAIYLALLLQRGRALRTED